MTKKDPRLAQQEPCSFASNLPGSDNSAGDLWDRFQQIKEAIEDSHPGSVRLPRLLDQKCRLLLQESQVLETWVVHPSGQRYDFIPDPELHDYTGPTKAFSTFAEARVWVEFCSYPEGPAITRCVSWRDPISGLHLDCDEEEISW